MKSDLKSLRDDWSYPTRIRFGAGRLEELPEICRELEMFKPLFVTDAGLAKLPMVDKPVSALKKGGFHVKLFTDFTPNPVLSDLTKGINVYSGGNHDGVIAFGGGSSIDVGKAIAFGAVQKEPIQNYLIATFEEAAIVVPKTNGNIPPIVSVPTTAGTGAEIGRTSAIIDEKARVKKGIFHPNMLPKVCLADPKLTTGLSPSQTAAFGMDALSHNLEAYCSVGYHPMADGCGLQGIKLIKDWLAVAVGEGKNLVARSHVMAASLTGGAAFQKGVGAVHALSHPLSSLKDIHHGLANGVLMPYVVAFNSKELVQEFTDISRYLNLRNPSPSALVEWLVNLRKEIGIPHTIAELGIKETDVSELAELAANDISASQNRVPITTSITRRLYDQALDGKIRWN